MIVSEVMITAHAACREPERSNVARRTYTTLVLSGKGRTRMQQARRPHAVSAELAGRAPRTARPSHHACRVTAPAYACCGCCDALRANRCARVLTWLPRCACRVSPAPVKPRARAPQVIDWVGGPSWDGCLIFDGAPLCSPARSGSVAALRPRASLCITCLRP